MIVLDIETSGLNFEKCGIWQIGAIELENLENVFIEECRIDDLDEIEKSALEITGKSEGELRNNKMKTQKEMIERFLKWCEEVRIRNFICQNPQFDLGFILSKIRKYGIEFEVPHRAFDLHSIASLKYYQINGNFLIENGKSSMSLNQVLKFCGLVDNRGKHNALDDVKLTAECFSRIVYGKSLFEEFNKYLIPKYLKLNDNELTEGSKLRKGDLLGKPRFSYDNDNL